MVLNLAVSDLLVSVRKVYQVQTKNFIATSQVYVLAVCGKSFSLDVQYCNVYREWRNSVGCSLLGALLVVGSEESVFTMVSITVIRMMVVRW